MDMNVLKYNFRWRYYLRHPLRFFIETRDNLRAAYRRVRYGWTYGDCWELGYWMLEVLPQMLRHLAENAVGYPGDDRFPTYESWQEHLISIANLLENARDEVRDKKNEYAPAYHRQLDDDYIKVKDENGNLVCRPNPDVKRRELAEKYFKRDVELAAEQNIMIEEAFKLLAETPLKALWD